MPALLCDLLRTRWLSNIPTFHSIVYSIVTASLDNPQCGEDCICSSWRSACISPCNPAICKHLFGYEFKTFANYETATQMNNFKVQKSCLVRSEQMSCGLSGPNLYQCKSSAGRLQQHGNLHLKNQFEASFHSGSRMAFPGQS